jgi:hypothetical protein
LDAFAFCQADEGRPGCLPHTWDATSDSVAARAAELLQAELILLKSVDGPLEALADALCPQIMQRAGGRVRVINARRNVPDI